VFTSDGVSPPNAKAAVLVPAADCCLVAVFKSLTSVQEVPFQDSVAPVAGLPPMANADVLSAPQPAIRVLAVFKFPTSVQDVPSQDSTFTVVGGISPPKAKADV
jgi:hypothetical protein